MHESTSRVKMAQAVQSIQHQADNNMASKVLHMWHRNTEQDQNIQYQRLLFILSTDPRQRTLPQKRLLVKVFDKDLPFFSKLVEGLPEDLVLKLGSEILVEKHEAAHCIFAEGELGRRMFFILEGEVVLLEHNPEEEFEEDGNPKRIMNKQDAVIKHHFPHHQIISRKKKHDHFGEMALEHRGPRSCTAVARSACVLATLSYESYQKVLGALQEQRLAEKLEFLRSVPPYKYWSTDEQLKFLDFAQELVLENNNILYKKGMRDDSVYLIKEGEIIVQRLDKSEPLNQDSGGQKLNQKLQTIGVYSQGQIIGDYEIHMNTFIDKREVLRVTSAQVRVKTIVLKLQIHKFLQVIKLNTHEGWLDGYFAEKFSKGWLKVSQPAAQSERPKRQSNYQDASLNFLFQQEATANHHCYIYHRKQKQHTHSQIQLKELVSNKSQMLDPTQLLSRNRKNRDLRKYLKYQQVEKSKLSPTQISYKSAIQSLLAKVQNSKREIDETSGSLICNTLAESPTCQRLLTKQINLSTEPSQSQKSQSIITLPQSLRHINIRQNMYKFQLLK